MINKIKIEYDSSPESHIDSVEGLLTEFGVKYNRIEEDGVVTIVYDKDYTPVEEEYKNAEDEARELSKGVVQYATALFKKQPILPETFNNGRICGPKDTWTFEECVNEAVMLMYKESKGFVEPMIVGTNDIDIQSVWNEENNYQRNHRQ